MGPAERIPADRRRLGTGGTPLEPPNWTGGHPRGRRPGPAAVATAWPALRALDPRIIKRDADIAVLHQVAMLRSLPAPTIEDLVAGMERVVFGPGATVFEEGQADESVYIVTAGHAEVTHGAAASRNWGPAAVSANPSCSAATSRAPRPCEQRTTPPFIWACWAATASWPPSQGSRPASSPPRTSSGSGYPQPQPPEANSAPAADRRTRRSLPRRTIRTTAFVTSLNARGCTRLFVPDSATSPSSGAVVRPRRSRTGRTGGRDAASELRRARECRPRCCSAANARAAFRGRGARSG
jgi:hypothetical protein